MNRRQTTQGKIQQEYENISSLVWDWNGTLLDDLDICVHTINVSLRKRRLPGLNKDRYREIFTFPVVDYYRQAGFDFEKEPYDILAREFMEMYYEKLPGAKLFNDVPGVLEKFRIAGFDQYILSAMEQEALEKSVRLYGIGSYFRNIQGADDIFAYGKRHYLQKLIHKTGISPEKTLLIGDTLHDREVAESGNLACLLVARGHQSLPRLRENGHPVIKNLHELTALFPGLGKGENPPRSRISEKK